MILGSLGAFAVLAVLFALALPLLIVWLLISLVRNADGPRRPPRDPAVEELRVRFARGEITEADFEQGMRLLGYERVDRS